MAIPFALLAKHPEAPADRLPEYSYDRFRQLNVTTKGDALIDGVEVYATTMTHNSDGFKKDDDFRATPMVAPSLVGPTMTHNSGGLKQDDA